MREYVLPDGKRVAEEPVNEYDILAKAVLHDTGNQNFFIRFENGHLVDPRNRDIRRSVLQNGQLRRVSLKAYQLYTSFLETKHGITLQQAEREI